MYVDQSRMKIGGRLIHSTELKKRSTNYSVEEDRRLDKERKARPTNAIGSHSEFGNRRLDEERKRKARLANASDSRSEFGDLTTDECEW